MMDWRKVETALEDFLRRQGIPGARAGGDLFIAAITPDVQIVAVGDVGVATNMSVDGAAVPQFVSLTDLAREMAEALS